MVIAHNMAAMNAQRQVNIVTDKKQKSTEKLSSGYRINRAADDAAGLSISEKMRKQIRGLNRSAKNIEDGISLVQVADGALAEDSDILQRMNVLAVQAANGTNSASDRADIQKEIDQLTSEIDRIAETTKFNEVYPLNSKNAQAITKSESWQWKYSDELTYTYERFINETGPYSVYVDDFEVKPGGSISLPFFASKGENLPTKHGLLYDSITGFNVDGKMETHLNGSSEGNKIYTNRVLESDLQYEKDGRMFYISKNSGDKTYITIVNSDKTIHRITEDYLADKDRAAYSLQFIHFIYGTKEKVVSTNSTDKDKIGGIWLQTGPDTLSGFSLELCDATTKSLGIHDPPIDVSTYDNCMDALNRVGDAITKVSSFRSIFGAQQNRLESAYRNNTNTAENTQAAESRIRDTDMADEVVNNAKQEILLQAGQAMISQANQQNQGVLSLLQ